MQTMIARDMQLITGRAPADQLTNASLNLGMTGLTTELTRMHQANEDATRAPGVQPFTQRFPNMSAQAQRVTFAD